MKRKNIKYYVIALVLIVTIVVLSRPYFIADSRFNAELKQLREEGIPLTLQEFENKYYTPTTASQNAAVVFNNAFSLFPYALHKCQVHTSKKELFDPVLDNSAWRRLPSEKREKVKGYVEKSTVFFNEMVKIQNYKLMRFNYKWADVDDMEMPELYQFQRINELYAIKTEFAIIRNDLQEVTKLLREMFHISSLMGQIPCDIGQLVFYGGDKLVLKKQQRAMSMLQFSSRQLSSYNEVFDNHEQLVVKGWPAMWELQLVNLLAKKNELFNDMRKNIKGKFKYAFFYFSGGLATILNHDMTILKKIINIPVDSYVKNINSLEEIEEETRLGFISSSPQGAYVYALKAIARLRCAKTACAVERFRLKYGRLPEGLKQLVPEFLNKIPSDPFDGKEIRYFRSNFLVEYEVPLKPEKKAAIPEEPVPAEIADMFGKTEIRKEPEYKVCKIKKTGFQIYSVGENLKDEKNSLIIEKHNSGVALFGTGINDDIIFTVFDK